jgi:hypothetical protein
MLSTRARPPIQRSNSSKSASSSSHPSIRTLHSNSSLRTLAPTPPASPVPIRNSVPPSSPTASVSSSDSAPSPPQSLITSPQSSSRKVAATLELFKETEPSSRRSSKLEHQSSHSSSRQQVTPQKRKAPPPPLEEVGEAQFVKRAEWPDRESVSRRERSSVALERVKSHESGCEDPVPRLRGRKLTEDEPRHFREPSGEFLLQVLFFCQN